MIQAEVFAETLEDVCPRIIYMAEIASRNHDNSISVDSETQLKEVQRFLGSQR